MIQTKKIGGHMKLVFLVIVISLIIPSVVFSDGAAPYTKEAVDKIYSAQKSIEPPKYDKKESNEERQRRWVEYNRNFFQKAGYNYDDTINAVVNDMRYHPERIPKTNANDSVFGLIYVTLNMMMSDCKYYKMDCLKFFNSKTAESVRWLSENTKFSF